VRVADLGRAADRLTAATPFVLRVAAGLLWLSNVSWKVPPDFGRTAGGCRGLCGFVNAGIEHPVAPGYPWLLREVVEPNLRLFGWGVLAVELLLAALLLSGTLTRAAALLGIVQSIAIGLSVANAPGEWYWSYALMVALHLAVFAFAAGRTHGVDALIRAGRPDRPAWLELAT
jgi:thiosulfate dehydrogenase [quinone] large subunit